MDDWADEKESLVSMSDEEKNKNKSTRNGDEQAGPSTTTSISITGDEKETLAEGNGETSAGTGIINSIASKFGVSVPGHSIEEEESAHKEEGSGGIINQIISNLPESLPMSEDDVPAADEALLLISIIED